MVRLQRRQVALVSVLSTARIGVKRYGTVRSGKIDGGRQLGGTPIDYQRTAFVQDLTAKEPNGVCAVVDPIGGRQLVRSYHALAKNGTLVVFGTASAAPGTAQPLRGLAATLVCVVVLQLRPGCRRVVPRAIDSATPPRPAECRQDGQTVLARLQDGTITPQIAQVRPLSEARHAHDLREASKVTGKIILQP